MAKTPYLVLFIVLIAVGVGTASALITITLAGDVIVEGNLKTTERFQLSALGSDNIINRVGNGVPINLEILQGSGDLFIADDLEVASSLEVEGPANAQILKVGNGNPDPNFSALGDFSF